MFHNRHTESVKPKTKLAPDTSAFFLYYTQTQWFYHSDSSHVKQGPLGHKKTYY